MVVFIVALGGDDGACNKKIEDAQVDPEKKWIITINVFREPLAVLTRSFKSR